MDNLQWFKFNYADWRMGKIQRCPEITQARFTNLCCLYWSKEGELSYEDAEIEIDKEHLDILISKKIIEINNDYVVIKFLNEQLLEISETSKGKKINGKLGNLKRWHKPLYSKVVNNELSISEAYEIINKSHTDSTPIADLSHTDSTPIADLSQNIAEKRREEKRREEERREEEKRATEDEAIRSIKEIVIDYKNNDRLIKTLLDSKEKLFSSNLDINQKLDNFVESLKLQDITTKKRLDFNKHFLSWVRLKKQSQQNNQSTSTLKQTPIEK